jgi:2,3-bisphosphoglycerate-independent phosphoglycerate mutase
MTKMDFKLLRKISITSESNLAREYKGFDFFFLHVKHTDSSGGNCDFARKVKVIEEVDRLLSVITELQPDIAIVTGGPFNTGSLEQP